MKNQTSKLIRYIALTFVGSLLIVTVSCQKEEKFSCDPVVNDWVKQYKSELQDVTREQLVTLPPRYQKAVFAALSPSTRLQIWQEKLDSVLLMPWDSITKSKIIDLKQHLTIAEYTRDIHTPPSNNMLQYAEAWENDMLGNGRVDSLQFVILFCTFMTYEEIHTLVYHPEDLDIKWIETNEDIKNILKAPWGVGGGGSAAMSDCECKYDIYCNVFLSDDCATPSGGCGTVYNCGLTGTSACKGMCPESMD